MVTVEGLVAGFLFIAWGVTTHNAYKRGEGPAVKIWVRPHRINVRLRWIAPVAVAIGVALILVAIIYAAH